MSLDKLTVAELKKLADTNDVDLTGKSLKADILTALEAAGVKEPKAKAEAKAVATADAKSEPKAAAKPQAKPEAKAVSKVEAEAETKAVKKPESKPVKKTESKTEKKPKAEEKYVPRAKPELDDETRDALGIRRAQKEKEPEFRRQEWWRYKKLGGKEAGWRRPRGIHSKMRRHYKYRPPVASIGYRTPVVARGLHPSGFEEVLVHRPADLAALDSKKQAARIGGTVGGRKAEQIEKAADKAGIRVLNRRST